MATDDAGKAADGQQQQEHNADQQQARLAADAAPSTTSSSLPPDDQPPTSVAAQRAGLAQALEELSRGERAADKLERELQAFEAKLEELLSSMGMSEEDLDATRDDEQEQGREATGGLDTTSQESKK
ncbi:uncharacterized protein SPSK_11039 [Sporothrix schenckii 1099-18]|uniref:Uncharacterized protein n=2 Tax=Sporothrix schenckii TaxID=29908 RepID=U7PS74_SPOS1|nr:uncharacterized protein SPSK_11039 [Sporothrix schenckii 1099-18]ERS98427.1 hypothetical protein HMPREF1624_05211 [Sporothrix schenckii ATCC 58251]KJR89432.1 hypothetical protein SPSK_11039 [Sporothrix schenckii 1099-18]